MARMIHVRAHPRRGYLRRDRIAVSATHVDEYQRRLDELKRQFELEKAKAAIESVRTQSAGERAKLSLQRAQAKSEKISAYKTYAEIERPKSSFMNAVEKATNMWSSFEELSLKKQDRQLNKDRLALDIKIEERKVLEEALDRELTKAKTAETKADSEVAQAKASELRKQIKAIDIPKLQQEHASKIEHRMALAQQMRATAELLKDFDQEWHSKKVHTKEDVTRLSRFIEAARPLAPYMSSDIKESVSDLEEEAGLFVANEERKKKEKK